MPRAVLLFQSRYSTITAKLAANKAIGYDGVGMIFVETDFAQREQGVGETVAHRIVNRFAVVDCLAWIIVRDLPPLLFGIDEAETEWSELRKIFRTKPVNLSGVLFEIESFQATFAAELAAILKHVGLDG